MAEDRSSRGKAAAATKDYHKAIPYLPERRPQRSGPQGGRLQGSKDSATRNLHNSFDSAASEASQSKQSQGVVFRIDLPKLSSAS